MTRTQFKAKCKALKPSINRLIDERIDKALNSGCLPLDSYDNDFELPKAFMSAVGSKIEGQFKPLTKELQKETNNIKLFI